MVPILKIKLPGTINRQYS